MKKIKDHKIKSVRKPIRPFDRTERTLKAQSDALTQHEATIARHTKLQTYVAVLTTAILATITWFQYKAGERQVELEYAKTANQYSVRILYEHDYGTTSDANVSLSLTPISISIKRESGLGTIGKVSLYQGFKLESYDSSCEIFIAEPFRQVNTGSFDLEPTRAMEYLIKSKRVLTPLKKKVDVFPTTTIIIIEFTDIFGSKRRDILKGSGSSFDVTHGTKDAAYNHYNHTAMLLKKEDSIFMSFSSSFIPECANLVHPYE